MDELKALTRASMEELRRALAGLRTSGLGDRTLPQALHALRSEISQRTGIQLTCQVDGDAEALPPAVAEVLWRVAQEALTNVEKHAQAHYVQMRVSLVPHAVTLRVTDDGCGLPPHAGNRPGHYGLRGMRERLEGLGGRLILHSNGQGGTLVEAYVPLITANPRSDTNKTLEVTDRAC